MGNTLLTPNDPEDPWKEMGQNFGLIAAEGILDAYREGHLKLDDAISRIGRLVNKFDRDQFVGRLSEIEPKVRMGAPVPMSVFKGMALAITESLVDAGFSRSKPGVYSDNNNAFVAASKFLKVATIDVSPATIASWWYK